MKHTTILTFSLTVLVLVSDQAFGENATDTVTTARPVTTQPPTTPPKTTNKETTESPVSTTTLTPEELCSQHNASCSECLGVAGAKCLWCKSSSQCLAYPVSKVLPPKDMCALDQARWGVCWLNFEALIIAMSVIGGIIILTFTCCCVYCCCCRGGGKKRYAKEDARYDAQKMERKAKNDERRAERKERLDEIRRKYGLMKDEPYQRFDA